MNLDDIILNSENCLYKEFKANKILIAKALMHDFINHVETFMPNRFLNLGVAKFADGEQVVYRLFFRLK